MSISVPNEQGDEPFVITVSPRTRVPHNVGDVEVSCTPGEAAARITGLPDEITLEDALVLADLLRVAVDRGAALKTQTQRTRNHPRNWGLARKSLPPGQSSVGASTWGNSLPEDENWGGSGWFAPHADPDVFGTPFAYCNEIHEAESANARSRFARGHSNTDFHVTWFIGLVGLPGVKMGEARWDDDEACNRLYDTVLACDPEANLVLAALTEDSDDMRMANHAHRQRQERRLAYSTFEPARMRIKPRLVDNAIGRALSTMPAGWGHVEGERALAFYARTGIISFDDPNSYQKPSIHAAAVVKFRRHYRFEKGRSVEMRPPTEEEIVAAAFAICETLAERQLGDIGRYVKDGEEYLIVASSLPSVMLVPAAFDIEEGTTLRRFTGDPDNLWEPVAAPE